MNLPKDDIDRLLEQSGAGSSAATSEALSRLREVAESLRPPEPVRI
jgi:hypothetical protein